MSLSAASGSPMPPAAASGPQAPAASGGPAPLGNASAPGAPTPVSDDTIGRELEKSKTTKSFDDFKVALSDAAGTLKTPALNEYGNMIVSAQTTKPDFTAINAKLTQLNGAPVGPNAMRTLDAGLNMISEQTQRNAAVAAQAA